MTPQELVQKYYDQHFRVVYWPAKGDIKGPTETGWSHKSYPLEGFQPGYRVGLLTGIEVAPGKHLHDVDIDWAPGAQIALALLPPTAFVFGRASKKISHCFYLLPAGLASLRFADIDDTCLIEFRGTKTNGDIGLQTMVPPSIWTKGHATETLQFVKAEMPAYLEDGQALLRRVIYAAIGMLLAKHFGTNGFGHTTRLAWAGCLLRHGIGVEDLVTMGEAMSVLCNNKELHDVRRSIESTAQALQGENKKVAGGPALAKLLGAKGRAVVNRIGEWLGKTQDFIRTDKGVIIKDSQENVRRAVETLGVELSYNEFSAKMLIDGRAVEDYELTDLWLRIDEEFKFRPTRQFFESMVLKLCHEGVFHPVKQYLDSLSWDGVARLDTWLIDAAEAEDSPYVRAVSSIVLMAAVARIYKPGIKYDELLVLEGGQGVKKSTALLALCPRAEWFSDDLPLNVTSQRLMESTLGKWIIEAAELAGKRKSEIEQLKAMLSRQVDGPARMAYARLPLERARQFIIIGTTNSLAYLPDPTGARRFWPVATSKFDVDYLLDVRDQLWAEARVRWQGGASIRLPEELWPAAGDHQEKRREVDPWEPLLRPLLAEQEPRSNGERRVMNTTLWDMLGIPNDRRDRYGATRITEVMQRLGFHRDKIRPPGGGKTEWGFVGVLVMEEGGDDEGWPGGKAPTDVPF